MSDDLASPIEPRYRSLDLWRGVACLMIVVHHAGFVVDSRDLAGTAGWEANARRAVLFALKTMDLGVPIFFVISGYCIAASSDITRRLGKSPWLFLKRRLRRIYPPYWSALLLFVAVTGGLDLLGLGRYHRADHALELASPGDLNRAQWLGNISLTETWRPLVGGGPEAMFTRVAWSLCYEEQFYLVCFLLLLVFPRRLYAALITITGVILAVRVVAWDSGWIARMTGTFVILWHEFAIGLAVYHRLNVAATPGAKRACEGFILAVLAAAAATEYRETAAAAVFGLLLIPLRRWDDSIADSRLLRPLFACGHRCYGIYLAHLPVCVVGNIVLFDLGVRSFWARVFVTIPLVSIVSVAFCFGFHALIERRFLNSPMGPRTIPVA